MSEHTWQVDKEPEWAEESGGYWAVYIDESKLIAKVYHGEANARLIAAAPSLLEKLELLYSLVNSLVVFDEVLALAPGAKLCLDEARETLEQASEAWAAIAKAREEQS